MKTRITYAWEQLRSTYWFIPIAMVAAAVVLSTGSLLIDRTVQGQGLQSARWLYSGGPMVGRIV